MIQSSRNKDDTMRMLELQLEEYRIREEDLQRRAGELQTQVDDANRRAEASNRRAGELQTQVNDANRRAEELVQDLQTSLAETTQKLRLCEDRLQENSTHWCGSPAPQMK